MPKNTRDTLLIYSGGLDSTCLLIEERDRIAAAVSFDYGSKHNQRELAAAARLCRLFECPHDIIALPFINKHFKSALLKSSNKPIPHGHYAAPSMKETIVPFRNGIMLSIAVGLAESNGLRRVIFAAHGGDHYIYPDCTKQFVKKFDMAAFYGTDAVRVEAPFNDLSKADILSKVYLQRYAYEISLSYSCYEGEKLHCGKCGTCVERKEAFAMAGIVDRTCYKPRISQTKPMKKNGKTSSKTRR